MKFIIILTLASVIYTTTSSANTCSQTFTPKQVEQQNTKDLLAIAVICTLCPPIVAVGVPLFALYHVFKAWMKKPYEKVASKFPKKKDFEAAIKHIQQLEQRLGLSQKKASRLALRSIGPFHFENSTQSQKLFEEMDHLTSHWGISKEVIFQSIHDHRHYEKKTDDILQDMYTELEKTGKLSREEAKRVIQSLRTINIFLINKLLDDISKLSQAGFTKEQITQIIELHIIKNTTYTDNPQNLLIIEKTSINEKKEILRQAGFTEEEIDRIPIEVMQKTKQDIIVYTAFWSFGISFYTLLIDGLQWLFTGSSFIW